MQPKRSQAFVDTMHPLPEVLPSVWWHPSVSRRVSVHSGCFLSSHYLKPLGLSQPHARCLLRIAKRRLHEIINWNSRQAWKGACSSFRVSVARRTVHGSLFR